MWNVYPIYDWQVSIAKAIPSLLEPIHLWIEDGRFPVSIAKAIPSLLERDKILAEQPETLVSIAKAIPSLLEPALSHLAYSALTGFNRESDSVTVGAKKRRPYPTGTLSFQSRKRFRHCWSFFR